MSQEGHHQISFFFPVVPKDLLLRSAKISSRKRDVSETAKGWRIFWRDGVARSFQKNRKLVSFSLEQLSQKMTLDS